MWRCSTVLLFVTCYSQNVTGFIISIDSTDRFKCRRTISTCNGSVFAGAISSSGLNEDRSNSLSSQDIIARARQAIGAPQLEDTQPNSFGSDLLEDMQKTLLLLEKRVKGGPRSLSLEEVEDFVVMTTRIAQDMDIKDSMPSKSFVQSAEKVELQNDEGEASRGTGIHNQVVSNSRSDVIVTSNDEGPAYTGEGGMGIAKGTRSTYYLPGMHEMSVEEYREALQKSVIDRQRSRIEKKGGMVGNRAVHNYLNGLGWGGASKGLSGESKIAEDS